MVRNAAVVLARSRLCPPIVAFGPLQTFKIAKPPLFDDAAPTVRDGSFLVQAIAAPRNEDKVEAAFKEEMDRALKDGFTAEEVAAAKSGWLQTQQVIRSGDGTLAAILATGDFNGRTLAWDDDLEKKVAALTPQQIVEALQRNIDISAVSIVKAGDFKKRRPRSRSQSLLPTTTNPIKSQAIVPQGS